MNEDIKYNIAKNSESYDKKKYEIIKGGETKSSSITKQRNSRYRKIVKLGTNTELIKANYRSYFL